MSYPCNPYIPALIAISMLASFGSAQEPWKFILPEQRAIQVRSPHQLCPAPIPRTAPPATVTDPRWDDSPVYLSLSEMLNLSLQNMDVVRVLSGVSATSIGSTIYDTAIANTGIDVARGGFDPAFNVNNNWLQTNTPNAIPDLIDPNQTQFVGSRTNGHSLDLGLSKRMVTGGIIDFGVIGANNRFPGIVTPLNPQLGTGAAVQMTQPLLQGAGVAVNQAPIVIARIDTERSYFQFKDSVQAHVRSVIQGYWELVQARTELWAIEQQVQQLEFAFQRAEDRVEIGDARLGELSQARVAYENFRASLLLAQANLLQRESALRNVLGLSPYDNDRIVPTSPLIDEKLALDWDQLLGLAEQYRPDIIELKLILEADQQRLLVRDNDALPRLDAVALYRWNGLEGTMPNGATARSGSYEDWSLGVNFSVPIGLRASRALLRQQELLVQRDHVNLQQGLHQASHSLAISVRNLELFYEQYNRYQEVRKAAQENLDQQIEIGNQLEQFIVLLQAVVDWGNAVSREAQALVQYNTELATLEFETGTILETHGITFVEERYGSVGPLGRHALPVAYPAATPPVGLIERYPTGDGPTEKHFDLRNPLERYREDVDGDADPESKTSRQSPSSGSREGGPQSSSQSSGGSPKLSERIKSWFRR